MKELELIFEKTKKVGDCLEWTGAIHNKTRKPFYPSIQHKCKAWRGNRLVWMLVNGPIPEGLMICHTCDNSLCIKPEHLYAGTAKDNTRDMILRKRNPWQNKSHCVHSHAMTQENTRLDKFGRRLCRECARLKSIINGRKYYLKNRDRILVSGKAKRKAARCS